MTPFCTRPLGHLRPPPLPAYRDLRSPFPVPLTPYPPSPARQASAPLCWATPPPPMPSRTPTGSTYASPPPAAFRPSITPATKTPRAWASPSPCPQTGLMATVSTPASLRPQAAPSACMASLADRGRAGASVGLECRAWESCVQVKQGGKASRAKHVRSEAYGIPNRCRPRNCTHA